jgi:hypothetical protein
LGGNGVGVSVCLKERHKVADVDSEVLWKYVWRSLFLYLTTTKVAEVANENDWMPR